ncbi:hypothetical protein, partial [Candidatus Frankia alpina]
MDIDSIVGRLVQVTAADSRELDRVCEAVASALVDDGVEPPFQIRSADFTADPWLVCADRYWRLRLLAEPTVSVAARCARWLEEHSGQAGPAERRTITETWALGYAFIARDTVESREELTDVVEPIREQVGGSPTVFSFAALYHAGKLRANFWFDELRWFLESSPLTLAAAGQGGDPLFVALRAFAACGSRTVTIGEATNLLTQAWTAQPRSRHVVDVCLHALWASPHRDHVEQLRRWAEEAVTEYPHDHTFHFRLAAGRRRCGHHRDALDAIDGALRLLPATGSRISHGLLQE